MREDISVVKLRARLVGKTVTSVEQSMLSESYYHIKTSDGESFHICGTELGSWIVDGPRHDGIFPTLDSVIRAITDHRYEKQMFDEDVEIVFMDGLMIADAGDGKLFSVRPSMMRDPWERKVLAHPKATQFLGTILKAGQFWHGYFIYHAEDMEEQIVPDELLLPLIELRAKD